jgi:hypothetical protein|tara:strand:- start:8695 stop:9105 length:411 start_codon:yes stop_codon:yes gene_type:complete
MAHWSDTQIEAAKAEGELAMRTEPRAAAVRYDPNAERVIVDLTNGATFAFPPRLAEFLSEADAEALADVEVAGAGFGLHWRSLDVDYTVAGLMHGMFGTKTSMREAARKAGSTSSAAKAAAARENGKKGGRPRNMG